MSDTSTPTEPKPAEAAPSAENATPAAPATGAPKPRKEFLDNLAVKFLFSLVAWAAPLPVAIVALKCWFTSFASENQSGTDPFWSLHHTVTSFTGQAADYIPLAALLPSAVLLSILYRSATGRFLSILVLCICALAEVIGMSSFFGGPGAQ